VGLQVEDVERRLAKKEIVLTVSEEVLEYLAKEGYDPKFGARPLKRVIQSKILTPVANMMVGEGMLQRGTVAVTMKKGELSFEVKKRVAKSKVRMTGSKKTKVAVAA
jgi:ATP-dependent Clp protease ATP-binding subunit ClpA